MFEFRKIRLSDRQAVNERLAVSDLRNCEYSFANNLAWQRLSDTEICFYGDFYLSCCKDDENIFLTFPTGVRTDSRGIERYTELFSQFRAFCENQGRGLVITSVTDRDLGWIKEYYGDKVSYELDRDFCDYIYNSTDLIELKGRKYHGKRNHIKRFMENDWSFEEINSSNIDECIRFAANVYNQAENSGRSLVIEQFAINTFFTYMNELELKGGLLKANGETVGVTIGERINSDTFVVHVEKAREDIHGAYPTLCSLFAGQNAGELRYINREEDMGIEGLRRSKLSYHPEFLLEKYKVNFKRC